MLRSPSFYHCYLCLFFFFFFTDVLHRHSQGQPLASHRSRTAPFLVHTHLRVLQTTCSTTLQVIINSSRLHKVSTKTNLKRFFFLGILVHVILTLTHVIKKCLVVLPRFSYRHCKNQSWKQSVGTAIKKFIKSHNKTRLKWRIHEHVSQIGEWGKKNQLITKKKTNSFKKVEIQ